MLIIEIIVLVLAIAGMWMTSAKAQRPGWGAIISIHDTYLLIRIAGRRGWWLTLFLIPLVTIIIWLIVAIDIARNFGHGGGFDVLL